MEALEAVFKDVFIGLIGSLITAGVIKLINFVRNKKLNKKYNISGRYITHYEDIIDDKTQMVYAPAKLVQRGMSVTGSTNMGSTEWEIEGKILDSGYIYGMYSAMGILDKGVGNFFLEMKDERLEGCWSGYDNVNNIVVSGKYQFIKIDIRKMTVDDVCKVIKIADGELGVGYLGSLDITPDKSEGENYCRLVALSKSKIIGFCLCEYVDIDRLNNKYHIENVPNWIRKGDMICMIKTVAVDKEWQGRGVAETLLDEVFVKMKEHGIKVMTSIGWVKEGHTNIGHLLEKKGMKSAGIIENYWKEDSINTGFICPVCGEPPCKCSAEIFFGLLE